MSGLLNGPGFLGTNAPFLSDATLVLIVLTAVLFTVGWRLAVKKRFDAHRRVQTFAVILNAMIVLGTMIRSYWVNLLPGIPEKLGEGSYGITTLHALIGLAGLALGIYILLQGYDLLPTALRFRNYKIFMRSTYALYMLATFTGVVVYIIVFVMGI